MPVPEFFQRLGDRRIVAPRERRIAANKPRPLEMVSRLAYASGNSASRLPGPVKVFREDSGLRLEETSGHHAIELPRPGEERFATRGFEPCKHGLEQMHMRVLLTAVGVGRHNAV